MDKEVINTVIENLEKRNIKGFYYDTLKEAKTAALKMIPQDVSVGIGNSQTLKKMEISRALSQRGNIVYDKTLSQNKEEVKEIKKKALTAKWYITGTNALSLDGYIVNIDHSGNRVAAISYGPDHVIIIIGRNKIESGLEEGINRARQYAAPLNAKRAGYHPPCLDLERCIDCKSKERVCYNLSIIEGQCDPERIKVFIINEDLGF